MAKATTSLVSYRIEVSSEHDACPNEAFLRISASLMRVSEMRFSNFLTWTRSFAAFAFFEVLLSAASDWVRNLTSSEWARNFFAETLVPDCHLDFFCFPVFTYPQVTPPRSVI